MGLSFRTVNNSIPAFKQNLERLGMDASSFEHRTVKAVCKVMAKVKPATIIVKNVLWNNWTFYSR